MASIVWGEIPHFIMGAVIYTCWDWISVSKSGFGGETSSDKVQILHTKNQQLPRDFFSYAVNIFGENSPCHNGTTFYNGYDIPKPSTSITYQHIFCRMIECPSVWPHPFSISGEEWVLTGADTPNFCLLVINGKSKNSNGGSRFVVIYFCVAKLAHVCELLTFC